MPYWSLRVFNPETEEEVIFKEGFETKKDVYEYLVDIIEEHNLELVITESQFTQLTSKGYNNKKIDELKKFILVERTGSRSGSTNTKKNYKNASFDKQGDEAYKSYIMNESIKKYLEKNMEDIIEYVRCNLEREEKEKHPSSLGATSEHSTSSESDESEDDPRDPRNVDPSESRPRASKRREAPKKPSRKGKSREAE